jgi:hypothetical protein
MLCNISNLEPFSFSPHKSAKRGSGPVTLGIEKGAGFSICYVRPPPHLGLKLIPQCNEATTCGRAHS